MNKSPKKTHATTWQEREKSLQGMDYAEYLESSEWKKIKAVARTREHYQKCYGCGCTNEKLEIHHRNYKWLNTKDAMRNLVALCRHCHQAIHDRARKENITVAQATRKYRKEYKKMHTLYGFIDMLNL